uniref:GRF-type domain-containing protein n=1 Tax=Fagus sylvatica TaxID=28930 RepID=A0A2N9GYU5_FAGSY
MSSSSSTGYFANGYLCHCGARSVVRTAWTIGNFGRRFRGCSRYKVQEHCGYFEWIDPPTCVRGTEIAAKIIEKSSKLEKSVLIAHEREVVARGMEARAREKEMMTRKKEKMYMHALVVSWCLIVVLLVSFWYSGQVGKMKKTLSLPV